MKFVGELLGVIVISLLTAAVSLAGGLLLLSGNKFAKTLQKFGPYIAVVVILYAVFGDLVPEAIAENTLDNFEILGLLVLGFAVCAGLGFALGHFHHHSDIHAEGKPGTHGNVKLKNRSQAISMVIVDTIHTAADGIMLGSTFAAGFGAGLGAAVSIAAHEIPQEIGDFSIMLESKMRKKQILKLEIFSAIMLPIAAVITYLVGNLVASELPAVLMFSAGFLLYIAVGEISCIVQNFVNKAPRQLKS